MSYLDKLKNNLNKEKIEEKKEIIKPGWIILNKEKYLKNIKDKKNTDCNITNGYNSITFKNENPIQNKNSISPDESKEIVYTKRDYHEDFYIKYGTLLLDFFIDMRDDFENNCYNILDTKEKGLTCFSYDFESFVMNNTEMIKKEEGENKSNGSDGEDEDFRF